MDFVTVLEILRRRWMVFGGAMLVTIATAAILSTLDLATYASEGTVVVVRGPGSAADDDVAGADPALQQTARILAEVAAAETGAGSDGQTTITVDENLPILRVAVTSDDGPTALDAATTVTDVLGAQLEELDQSPDVFVPDGTSLQRLVPPTDPQAVTADDGTLTFSSRATLLLTRTTPDSGSGVANGIIDPDDSVNFVTGVIAERFTDDTVEQEMIDDGATGEITLEFDELNPMIRVHAESEDPEVALRTGQVAVDTLQRIAADIQAADQIPEDLRFHVEALSYPLEAEVFDSARLRTVLAVVALGLLASMGLALMADAAEERRLARRQPAAPAGRSPRTDAAASSGSWWLESGGGDPALRDDTANVSWTSAPPDQ